MKKKRIALILITITVLFLSVLICIKEKKGNEMIVEIPENHMIHN